MFREILEAALIVGIVLSYLKRIDARNHFKQVWLGVAAGAGSSIVGAVLFQLIAGGFSGRASELFEGFFLSYCSGPAFHLHFLADDRRKVCR